MAAPAPRPDRASGTVTRRTSTRQLRRLPSRTRGQDANDSRPPSRNSDIRMAKLDPNDSSDDEIPMPMKLSKLTRALLNGDVAESERAASPPETRRRCVLTSSNGSSNIIVAEKRAVKRSESIRTTRSVSTRQPSRPTSRQSSRVSSPPRSRESSPVRKRVVRLSATPVGGTRVHRRSISTNGSVQRQPPRPTSRASGDEKKVELANLNTPAQDGRHVRIAIESSATHARMSGSSATRSRRTDTSANSDTEAVEEPVTVNRPSSSMAHGSISRAGFSTISRTRPEEVPATQNSMRIKRIGKGSFLSGPARRGRRRHSEEENSQLEEQDENLAAHSSQEPQERAQDDEIPVPLSSFYGGISYRDLADPGSPSSAASRRKASSNRASPEIEQSEPDPVHGHKSWVARSEAPSAHGKENNPPLTFKKKSSVVSLHNDDAKLAKVRNADLGLAPPASPERKPLSTMSKNTPLRAAPPPPPKMSVLDAVSVPVGTAAAQSRKRNMLKLNNKYYTRIKCLGRGGSAKVYRVTTDSGEMLAMKRVSTENADEAQVRGYKGEIDLLKRLSCVDRVINLLDYEMNEEKQLLSLLMEAGDLDFNIILREKHAQEDTDFDPVFVRFYWKEMLECVSSIHKYDVVHSDLKPANFVSVHGRLKLIDFGIANAIQTDETVNVHRDTQVGTPNYMSPESLIDSNHAGGPRVAGKPKLMKLGKPSDIWSLGCILYQMVYGTPPFGHIPNQYARCHAIINWNHAIEFPEYGLGGLRVPHSLLRTMKCCLAREVHLRPTAEELLAHSDPFLYPVEVPGTDGSSAALPVSEDLLSRIIQSVVMRCKEGIPSDTEVMSAWPKAYWLSAQKHVMNTKDSASTSSSGSGRR